MPHQRSGGPLGHDPALRQGFEKGQGIKQRTLHANRAGRWKVAWRRKIVSGANCQRAGLAVSRGNMRAKHLGGAAVEARLQSMTASTCCRRGLGLMILGVAWAVALAQASTNPVPVAQEEVEIVRLMDVGQPADALALAVRALAQARRDWGERDPRSIALLALQSSALTELGRPAEALPLREEALALRAEVHGADDVRTFEDGTMRLISLAQLGRLAAVKSDGKVLLARQERMLGAQHPATLGTLMTLGVTLTWLGEWQEALHAHERAFRTHLTVSGALHADTLSAQSNYAVALFEMGRLAEAEPMARAAWQGRLKTLGAAHGDTALSLTSYGSMQKAAGRLAAALASFETADRHAQQALGPSHPYAQVARVNLASGLIDDGQTARATALLTGLLAHFERSGSELNPYALRAHVLMGQVLARQGQWVQAEAHGQAAVRGHEALGQSGSKYGRESLLGLARAQAALGDRPAAMATLRQVIETVERQRLHTTELPDALRRVWLRSMMDGYQPLIAHLRESGNDAESREAFRLSETLKARVLVEQMAQGDAAAQAALPQADLTALRQQQAELAEASALLAKGVPAAERPALLHRATALSRALYQRQAELAQASPRYAQLTRPPTLGATEGARLLQAHQRYLSFMLDARQQLSAAVLAPTGELRWVDLGAQPDLGPQVERLRQLVSGERRDAKALTELGAVLSARLLQPLAAHLPVGSQVLIAPDGPLWLLPWDALPWQGRPWGQTTQLQLVHSLAVLQRVQERLVARSEASPLSLLALGAPSYPLALAGTDRGRVGRRSSLLRSGQTAEEGAASLAALSWPRLPFAQVEMDQVAALFPAGQVQKIQGDDATETRLRALSATGELARFRYVLFSAHGYFDPQRPEFSSLVLKPDGHSPERDGFVSVPEWLPLRLGSELVVLSACDTARGRVVSGDGLVGLSYALMVAGNANTLATLWPVADRETAWFVSRFFARVRAGQRHPEALAQTKREFMQHRDARLRHPRHWAGFVLYGA
ncbi:CHAT domain-containing tetratricopeptide repeat protein [Roseateles sp. LKC17W]